MNECWQFRSDIKGRPAKTCYGCSYYAGKRSGAIDPKIRCWEYQKCTQKCEYRTPSLKKDAPTISTRGNLLKTAGRYKQFVAKSEIAKARPAKPPPLSEESSKLIAETLKIMLRGKK